MRYVQTRRKYCPPGRAWSQIARASARQALDTSEACSSPKRWPKARGIWGQKQPLLRDVDSYYYLRQEKFGPYEANCKPQWQSEADPMPEDFSFQLYPDNLERLEWHMEDAMAGVPILGSAGVIHGPIPRVPSAYEACVFTFGIAQADKMNLADLQTRAVGF